MSAANDSTPSAPKREIWGVLGGMGPLASAEFLSTIYEEFGGGREQESPIVYMISDPTIPDRTECLKHGREDLLLEHFSSGINKLVGLGAARIVVCCVTIHPLIERLAAPLRGRIVSLVDMIFEGVMQDDRRHLLVRTEGSRQMRIFEDHPGWRAAGARMVLPDDADQAALHSMIYEVKKNQRAMRHLHLLEDLMAKYEVHSFIAGCTEMHMVARQMARVRGRSQSRFCVDPLMRVAAMMAQHPQDHQVLESQRHIFCH